MFEKGELKPDTKLTGHYVDSTRAVDTESVLREIQAAAREEAQKRGLSKYAQKNKDNAKSFQLRSNDPKPLTEEQSKKIEEQESEKRRKRQQKRREQHNKNNKNNRKNNNQSKNRQFKSRNNSSKNTKHNNNTRKYRR